VSKNPLRFVVILSVLAKDLAGQPIDFVAYLR